MKIFIGISSIIFVFSLNLAWANEEEPDAHHLVKEIKRKGAKAVISELMLDHTWTRFEKICDKIETGDKEWLEVARLLAPGSDAATAESLMLSVARALPKSPRLVLALVAETEADPKAGFTVEGICISPFIEPKPGVSEAYLIETEHALEATYTGDDPRLACLRLKCLENIRSIIGNAKKQGIWKPKE